MSTASILPDNRIRFPSARIDFANDVGIASQDHDDFAMPGSQARYDHMRLYLTGLLSQQASFCEPTQYRVGTPWFDLNSFQSKIRVNSGFIGLADTIALQESSEGEIFSLSDWYDEVTETLASISPEICFSGLFTTDNETSIPIPTESRGLVHSDSKVFVYKNGSLLDPDDVSLNSADAPTAIILSNTTFNTADSYTVLIRRGGSGDFDNTPSLGNSIADKLMVGSDLVDIPTDNAASRADKFFKFSANGEDLEFADIDLTAINSRIDVLDLDVLAINSRIGAIESGISRRAAVLAVVDASAIPPTEVDGDRYILGTEIPVNAAWDSASNNQIVEYDGASWVGVTPSEGWVTYDDSTDSDYLFVDDGTPQWEQRSAGGVTDHGALTGLLDDDHTQYALADGSRGAFSPVFDQDLNKTDEVVFDAAHVGAEGSVPGEVRFLSSTTGQHAMFRGNGYGITAHAGIGIGNWDDYEYLSLGLGGLAQRATSWMGWSSTASATGTPDIKLYRDAAGSMASRDGSNPQSFAVYNFYTDATNYERLRFFTQTGDDHMIVGESVGTGVERDLTIKAGSSNYQLQLKADGGFSYSHPLDADWFSTDKDRYFGVGPVSATQLKILYGTESAFSNSSVTRCPLGAIGAVGQTADLFRVYDDPTNRNILLNVDSAGSLNLTKDLIFAESADHSSVPAAGMGYLWLKSDSPNILYFTDDAGTDHNLLDGTNPFDQSLNTTDDPEFVTVKARLEQTFNQWFFTRNGTIHHRLAWNTQCVINDSGFSGASFRVETNNLTHALFVDAANDRVRMQGPLRLQGTVTPDFSLYSAYTDETNYERLLLSHAGTTFTLEPDVMGTGVTNIFRLRTSSANSYSLYENARIWSNVNGYKIQHSTGGALELHDWDADLGAYKTKLSSASTLELQMYSDAADPVPAQIDDGFGTIWKNTTSGTIKLWVNDGGTLSSITFA